MFSTMYVKKGSFTNYRYAMYVLSFFLGAVFFRILNTPGLLKKRSLNESSATVEYKVGGRLVTKLTMYNETAAAQFEFPTVEERIQYYMGGWITAKGIEHTDLIPEFCNKDIFAIGDHPGPVILDHGMVSRCIDSGNDLRTIYCSGVLPMLVDPTMHTMRPRTYQLMVLARFGDATKNMLLPMFVKARNVTSDYTYRNILWPFNPKRHYEALFDKTNRLQSIPWQDKKDSLIWRGARTGTRLNVVPKLFNYHSLEDIDVAFKNPHANRNLTDAEQVRAFIRPKLRIKDMVKYRYLLSLEGNDVASGLKWMLWSNSVVLMAIPTKASWAMEDMLQPFVHYIPVKEDYSDVPEMLEWARQHQEECSQISYRAAVFMYNLVMSDQAQKDNELILKYMRILYQQRFGNALYGYCKKRMEKTTTNWRPHQLEQGEWDQ